MAKDLFVLPFLRELKLRKALFVLGLRDYEEVFLCYRGHIFEGHAELVFVENVGRDIS